MSDRPDARTFALADRLPLGITVLEASAGTGKTHRIASLAARHVAEGLPLDRLLLVSFTHAATGELRDRVRARLIDAHRALADLAADIPVDEHDELLVLLAEGPTEVYAARLAHAVADFDSATITTTHGFCGEMLRSLGVAGDVDREYRLVEDPASLVRELVADLYVRGFVARDPPISPDEAREIVRLAIENPTAPIAAVDPDDAIAGVRGQLAQAARVQFEQRKRRAAVLTFDDLLTRLRAALEGDGGPAIAARLRRRYNVALVDEFQDTDPVQWAIVRRTFAEQEAQLVLIGDPKQAVYAFRGADVYEYLAAARGAAAHLTLTVNWRSGESLIDAYDALFGNARLGHDEIVYRPVRAAANGQAAQVTGSAPLRFRVIRRTLPSVALTGTGYAETSSARATVVTDLVAEAVAMLDGSATFESREADGRAAEPRRLEPHDLAVLVRTRYQAEIVKRALDAAGVPAVLNDRSSVFAGESARQWLRLLEALERPGDMRRARVAVLTPFLGWAPERVATAGAEEWGALQQRLREWADVARVAGVAALTETMMAEEQLPARLLAHVGGERELTDLRHVAELLHATAEGRGGIAPLAAWLRRRIDDSDGDGRAGERPRRLESDAAAVEVLTIHGSKGLEFPVVLCPFLWDQRPPSKSAEPVSFHDAAHEDRRTLDVGQARREERGEELRLAYVALTRARCQAVVWWAGTFYARDSALGRLLFARDPDGTVAATGNGTPPDEEVLSKLAAVAGEAPDGCIAVEAPEADDLDEVVRWVPPPRAAIELDVARLQRALDESWRRTSYSGIVAGQYEQRVASEVEEAAGADDLSAGVAAAAAVVEAGGVELAAVPALLEKLPPTARVGTLVHSVLETTDFAADELEAELQRGIDERLARRGVDVGSPAVLAAGLRAAIETPLGALAGGLRLCDLTPADRLDELTFELPLVGGDVPAGEVTLDAVAAAIEAGLPADDPLAGYAERLADPELRRVLRGYLTGSIDVVARIRQGAERPRFAVIDYKTNRLSRPDEPLTAWHHRPEALAAEMVRGHYVLQALLYSVALHRYLRWRLPDYDPERDVAGVLYLFLRGMTGPDTPVVDGTPCGVFSWRPPTALVERLSDLLETGGAA